MDRFSPVTPATRPTGRRALLVAAEPAGVARFRAWLESAGFAVRGAQCAAEARRLLLEEGTDLLIVALPLRGAEMAIAALRLPHSASRLAGALVLGSRAECRASERVLGRMANRLLRADCGLDELERAIHAVLRAAPRAELPRGSRLRLGDGGEALEVANLSATGMLARGLHPLPLGAELDFVLEPGNGRSEVRGRAKVVRITGRPGTSVGIGLRILALGGEGGDRMARILESATTTPEPAAPSRPSSRELPVAVAEEAPAERAAAARDLLGQLLVRRAPSAEWLVDSAERTS